MKHKSFSIRRKSDDGQWRVDYSLNNRNAWDVHSYYIDAQGIEWDAHIECGLYARVILQELVVYLSQGYSLVGLAVTEQHRLVRVLLDGVFEDMF